MLYNKMKLIWSYILVALCLTVTSAGVIDFLGNRDDFHDNADLGPKEEKVLTPPSDNDLNIDYDGYPGNSNENLKHKTDYENPCLKSTEKDSTLRQWPQFLLDVFKAIENHDNMSDYNIIPFDKEDFTNLEGSELCKMMCNNGVYQPPCKC